MSADPQTNPAPRRQSREERTLRVLYGVVHLLAEQYRGTGEEARTRAMVADVARIINDCAAAEIANAK